MLLKPGQETGGLLGKFYKGFNRVFDRFTGGYVNIVTYFLKKLGRVGIIVGIIVVFILLLGKNIPGGFVPEEDQGYFMINMNLPDAASLERTMEVMNKIEGILAKEEGIEFYTGINGFSLLTNTYNSNMGFFFISLKEWKERGDRDSFGDNTQAES